MPDRISKCVSTMSHKSKSINKVLAAADLKTNVLRRTAGLTPFRFKGPILNWKRIIGISKEMSPS